MRFSYDITMIMVSALATALTLPNTLSWAWVMLASSVLLQGGASSWNMFDGWRHERKHDDTQARMDRRMDDVIAKLNGAHDGIGRLQARVEAVEVKMDVKFDEIDKRFDKLEARFDKLEARFDKLEARFDKLEARFDKLEARFDVMEDKFDQLFKHLMLDPPADVTTKADVQEAIERSLVTDHGFCGVKGDRQPGQTLDDLKNERIAMDSEIRRRHAFGLAE
jgi:predicted nuclease with TOPRIM domain